MDAFTPSPAGVTDTGSAITLQGGDPYHVRGRLTDPATGEPTAVQACWFHFVVRGTGITDKAPFLTFLNSEDVEVLKVLGSGTDSFTLQVLTAAGFQQLGKWAMPDFSADVAVDVQVDLPKGLIALYWNQGETVLKRGVDVSKIGDIATFRIGVPSTFRGCTFSQVIVAAYNTIGHTVRIRRPSAVGSLAGWSGDAAAVSESAINDATAISTSAEGAITTFAGPALPATAAGSVIKAVAVAARVRKDTAVAPTNIRAVLKVGGQVCEAPANVPISDGYAGTSTVFPKNPQTGERWQIAEVNSEFGLKATA
ncbi:hypothetical protein [Sphingomonas desiccabilis]|uniref:Uncharacterized protein n=1 Tax=Sphingomonas desiccabilis TaxID=429134 RepID=A0A4Q2IVU3_9SPHN|nr:hypothetical protein [Sphingomonas desiccabilis]MBB3910170.1 hypothetical protein [Sphingomonas desiccabilis]RXZ34849.1 hypothetical protein EO081_04095 [Sphingomonas desiccabilis]